MKTSNNCLLSPARHLTPSGTGVVPGRAGLSRCSFVLEMVDQAGGTVWLADFLPDELELVWRAGQ
jgi:hypothetical protein